MNRQQPAVHGETTSLYPRMSRSAARAARLGRRPAPGAGDTFHEACELTFDSGEWGIDEFAARDDNEIVAGLGFAPTEQLACQSFGAVPDNGATDLPGRCDPETRGTPIIRHREERHESPTDLAAALVSALEFAALAHVFPGTKRRRHGPENPPGTAVSARPTRSAFCDPWLSGA
jgi:hypothetical protein